MVKFAQEAREPEHRESSMVRALSLVFVVLFVSLLSGCGGGGTTTTIAPDPTPTKTIEVFHYQGEWAPLTGNTINVGELVDFHAIDSPIRGGYGINSIKAVFPDGTYTLSTPTAMGIQITMAGKWHFVVNVEGETTPVEVDLTAVMPTGIVPVYAKTGIPLVKCLDGVYICPIGSEYIVPSIKGLIPWGDKITINFPSGMEVTGVLNAGAGPNGFGCLQSGIYTARFTDLPGLAPVHIEALADYIGTGGGGGHPVL